MLALEVQNWYRHVSLLFIIYTFSIPTIFLMHNTNSSGLAKTISILVLKILIHSSSVKICVMLNNIEPHPMAFIDYKGQYY